MLKFGTALDVGKSRFGKPNQDFLKVIKPLSRLPLLVLADGIGGYEGGTTASKLIVNTFEKTRNKFGNEISPIELLEKATIEAHNKILYSAHMNPDLSNMGSTVVAVVVDQKNNRLFIANVGDSRAYLFHRSGLKQLSLDHSEVAELKRNNVLDTQQALNYRRKNILTQSISASRTKNSLRPHFDVMPFVPESAVLLCSDGLWGVVPEILIHLITMEFPPTEAAKRLVELANNFGGPDNISVVIARRFGDANRYKKKYSIRLEDTY